MKPIVTLIAPGNMGASLGARLTANGIEVRTSLEGRSAATIERAQSAGMVGVDDDALYDVDIVLSVLPPSEAMPLVKRMAKRLGAMEKPPLFVDCNAVSSQSAGKMAAVMSEAGAPFVDGGIIGGPARVGYVPKLYVSGERASEAAVLNDYGLFVPVLDGPVGAASALKMSYAGITKGLTAIGTSMVLAAERAGAGEALYKELADTQSQLLARFSRNIPNMFSKARRWGPEMQEISEFVSERAGEEQVYQGFAALYERIADDFEGENKETETLRAFFARRDDKDKA